MDDAIGPDGRSHETAALRDGDGIALAGRFSLNFIAILIRRAYPQEIAKCPVEKSGRSVHAVNPDTAAH